jgi:menaquinone-9 beta-reductase
MDYDVISVGGGLAGAALARGYWSTQLAGAPEAPLRDLVETSPHRAGSLNLYHPAMQTVMLGAAEAAGAAVRRGAKVVGVSPGQPASVRVQEGESQQTYSARLVVGADGRTSSCRKWGEFAIGRDPERMVVAGVLLEGLRAPEDAVRLFIHSDRGKVSLAVPLGGGRFRCYVCHYRQGGTWSLSGREAFGDFIAASMEAGAPREWYEGVTMAGPLASFEGADTWVEHPYRNGVALIGDAASSSDPSFGCGLSLTLRDVRTLRDQLLSHPDWNAAAHAYAVEHDRYYGAIHRITDWMTQLFYDPGPEGAARRERALPLIAEDPRRIPDVVGVGPDAPSDESARRRLFGEE